MSKVSCIIIYLDTDPRFLEEAIQSVLSQSHRDIELILIDDGTTRADTLSLSAQYQATYPEKVRYFTHADGQNHGMSVSRNLGLAHACGDYIAYLDSDDVLTAAAIEQQLAIFLNHADVAAVYGPACLWHQWEGSGTLERPNQIDTPALFKADPDRFLNSVIQPPDLVIPLITRQISMSGLCVRKSALESLGGFEESFTGLYEDQVLCVKLCSKYPVYSSEQCWYYYRQHATSCCAVAEQNSRDYSQINRPEFLHWAAGYLEENNLSSSSAFRVVRLEQTLCRHASLRKGINLALRVADKIRRMMS